MTQTENTLITINTVSKSFTKPQSWVDAVLRKPPLKLQAVNHVSFSIPVGQTVGLVGESGSGKSTLARCIIRLYKPDEGEILYRGTDISHFTNKQLEPFRCKMQMVFQDPNSSLNPRMTIGNAIEEVLQVHNICPRNECREQTEKLIQRVGLPSDSLSRKPISLSGGQRQRAVIARALAVNPELLIADEPVSALDVSIQAQIINLLHQLQQDLNLTMLFISHDLRVVRHISSRIVVMYLGKILEMGQTSDLYEQPLHPYTIALLNAVPTLDKSDKKKEAALQGETPSAYSVPQGCCFHTRCPKVMPICAKVDPATIEYSPEHFVACHLFSSAKVN
jgi:peptide/nickel transport system ATP-binding protein